MVEDPSHPAPHGGALGKVALAALGVVFGDIGTSPLYTLRECISGPHGASATPENVLGVLSLIFWALTMVVTVKYLGFVMRADNHGEGGILALLALTSDDKRSARLGWVALLVVAGAALLYGDGIITPSISVLSAVEGLEVATDELHAFVVPITCVLLFGLFYIQSRGTGHIGRLFGPVMLAWFGTLAALGAVHVARNPSVLWALSPAYGARYFEAHGVRGVAVLGSVVLAVTGGEALYADMGHFGVRPIRVAWLSLVWPALLLAYFGQGALLLRDPSAAENPFFAMVPTGPATYALVALATAATIIASQALISGAFSLTHQAVQLGLFPRVTIRHTSEEAEGQIYVPEINWGLAVACIALVLAFKHSSNLAAAYGIAVSGTMAITSIVYYVVVRHTWGWSRWRAVPLLVLFLAFDLPFLGANMLKIADGGYVPILVGAAFFVVMVVWRRGRALLGTYIAGVSPPLDQFLSQLTCARVPGCAVFMSSSGTVVPPALLHQVRHIHVLHERIIILTVTVEHQPLVPHHERITAEKLTQGFSRVTARYGFMEQPNVPLVLADAAARGLIELDPDQVTYYVGRETFLATDKNQMGAVTESLFSFLSRNARPATAYFDIPPDRVVEIGLQIDL